MNMAGTNRWSRWLQSTFWFSVIALGVGLGAPLTVNAAVNVNQLVKDSAPAIVQVQGIQWIKVKIPDQYKNITDDPVYRSLSSILIDNPSNPQSAPVVKKRLIGSGFILSAQGSIATNDHWVRNAHEVVVVLADRRSFKAAVVRSDAKSDVAMLKITAGGLPTLSLARQVDEGEGVLAVGANQRGVSVGVIVSTPTQTPASGLVSDVTVSRDNSGGPLLNIYGQVLGINSTQLKTSLGMYRHPTLTKLASDGFDAHTATYRSMSFIGFSATNMDEAQNAALGLTNASGALVIQVRPGSIAANAGLQKNDVIVGLESQSVVDADDLNALADFLRQDGEAHLSVFRAGDTLDLKLVSPKSAQVVEPWSWRRLGLKTREIARAQRDAVGIANAVLVTQVQEPAQSAGIQTGDWLVSFNQKPLTGTAQLNTLTQQLSDDDAVVLYVVRGTQRQFVTINTNDQ